MCVCFKILQIIDLPPTVILGQFKISYPFVSSWLFTLKLCPSTSRTTISWVHLNESRRHHHVMRNQFSNKTHNLSQSFNWIIQIEAVARWNLKRKYQQQIVCRNSVLFSSDLEVNYGAWGCWKNHFRGHNTTHKATFTRRHSPDKYGIFIIVFVFLAI